MNKLKVKLYQEVEIDLPYYFKYTISNSEITFGKIDINNRVKFITNRLQSDSYSNSDYQFGSYDFNNAPSYFLEENKSTEAEFLAALEEFDKYLKQFGE